MSNRKPTRKAREWWLTLSPDGVVYDGLGSLKDAREYNRVCLRKGWRAVHVREVLPKRRRKK